jgi:hypothetical protein
MACLIIFSLTWIPRAPTIFGKNCSSYRAPNCISKLSIILRLMTKLKLSTSVWKNICDVFHMTDNISGLNGYH